MCCYSRTVRVVFLSPSYPPEMVHYTLGLARVGVQVFGVGDAPAAGFSPELKAALTNYLQVPAIMDESDTMERVRQWLRGRSVDRILANWEPLVLLAARMRERWGVPGMSVDAVRGFRDKELMKTRLRQAGLRVPRSRRARTEREVREAAEVIGFPMVIKPISGAGSADTHRVDDARDLDAILPSLRHVREASCEEYVIGEEYTYDTLCVNGRPVYENVAHYLPKPIEARSQEWISPVIITVRDLKQVRLQAGIELGRSALQALGMGDGFTHMEWFSTPDGEAVFGEVGCRPGGAHLVDQMNYTSDDDLFTEWARVVCHGSFRGSGQRKFNVAIVFKRALGRGRITRIEGLEAWKRQAGSSFVHDALLRPGQPRRNWKNTLLSDGHLLLRHPDFEEARRLAFAAATDVTMYAEV